MLDIPFVVGIDGRQFKGERLSLVAAEITGLMDPALDGATRLMRFMFPFKGFSVTLEVLGQVQSLDRGNGHATVNFVDPAGEHLPQLRHLINSYIAGDLVALGEVIGVAPSIPSPANRAAAMNAKRLTFSRVLGSAGLAVATLALLAAVGTLAYNRIFTQPLDRTRSGGARWHDADRHRGRPSGLRQPCRRQGRGRLHHPRHLGRDAVDCDALRLHRNRACPQPSGPPSAQASRC